MVRHMTAWGRQRRRQSWLSWQPGQSLTEFAIMVPIIVLVLWFSIYFSEIIQVRLKLQEAARFAAWEFTAYPMHDYDQGTGSRFDEVEEEITELTLDIYEDLDSSDQEHYREGAHDRNTFLATGWEIRRVRIREDEPPDLTGDWMAELGLDILLTIEGWIESLFIDEPNTYASGPVVWMTRNVSNIDHEWGFNDEGWVHVEVQARVHNLMVPRSFRRITSLEYDSARWVRSSVRLEEHSALLVDSWRLNDGRDVRHGDESGGYFDQVNRIFLLDRGRASAAIAAMEVLRAESIVAPMSGLLPATQRVPDAAIPVVVSLNHHTDQDGRIQLHTDGGRSTFDTTPLSVEHIDEDNNETPLYQDTLDNRGEYQFGCEEPMNATCGAGLGTENPFGDGVHWPPPGR